MVFSREDVFDIAVHELTAGRAGWREPASAGEPSALHSIPAPAMPLGDDEPAHLDASLQVEGGPYRDSGPPRTSTTEELHRGLAHVFSILGLTLEREPLSIAYRAMRSEDRSLRGTAHEYLEVVLPSRVRDVILPLLGDVKRAAEGQRARGTKELADELLRSSGSIARPSR